MTLFTHQYGMEPNVDHLEVLAPKGCNVLRFLQQSPGDGLGDVSTECTLDREAVQRLYSALGEWLYPTGAPHAAEALAAHSRAVTEAMGSMASAVTSLHLSVKAVVKVLEREERRCGDCTDGNHPHGMWPCVREGCHCTDTVIEQIRIGRTEPLCHRNRPSDAHTATRCTWCGHLWTEHAPEPEPQHHGRLMSELPRRSNKPCINCEHFLTLHNGVDGRCVVPVESVAHPPTRECGCLWGDRP